MTEYISFDELDQYVSSDPLVGGIWTGLSEHIKMNWYKWIHNQINHHPWRGDPLTSFIARQAFPRRIHSVNRVYPSKIWSFDSDSDATEPDYVIIPRQLLAEAVVQQQNSSDITELIQLRDIGVKNSIVGPLETEFHPGQNSAKLPLPQPLWDELKGISLLNTDYDEIFRIQRA